MRPSVERNHSQDGVFITVENGDFARYNSLDRAAQDIVLYMKARQWPTHELSLFSFVSLMKQHGYFIEPLDYYYNAVNAWLQR
jgi:hypothetical protein